jgi:transposase
MLREKIYKKFKKICSIKTISNYLKNIHYTKKKIVRRFHTKSLIEHKLLRKDFKNKLKNIDKNKIICVDECGLTKELYNKYGWALKGKRIVRNIYNKNLPKKYSFLMAINKNGIIYYEKHESSINTNIYEPFIEVICSEYKDHYILMDNVSFHKSYRIKKAIEDSGNHILFIPPYSPDYNPIEEVFSEMKAYIRKFTNPYNMKTNINELIAEFDKKSNDFSNYYIHAFS